MKISGATFGRNLIELDYPVVEAINSILPIADEFIVNIGKSQDNTLELIRSIKSEKIKIIESVWDDTLRTGGLIFSQQASIAISHCKGDWIFYLNADEVVHEKELPIILSNLQNCSKDKQILGLMFRYYHFDGDYWSINPWRYHKQIRIFRNDGRVKPDGDMSGFVCTIDGLPIKGGPKERYAYSGGHIYHYGWVRKSSKIMFERNKRLEYFYHDDDYINKKYSKEEEFDYPYYGILKEFKGSHPKVMEKRINNARRLRPRRNRWLNWRFYQEVFRHGFKG